MKMRYSQLGLWEYLTNLKQTSTCSWYAPVCCSDAERILQQHRFFRGNILSNLFSWHHNDFCVGFCIDTNSKRSRCPTTSILRTWPYLTQPFTAQFQLILLSITTSLDVQPRKLEKIRKKSSILRICSKIWSVYVEHLLSWNFGPWTLSPS